ncbi:bifunctional nuclease family protein [bacterium]|nr:bifunctional nuclease family protein [bacterium]
MSLCKMQVYKLGIDLIAHDPVIILTDETETHSLPITIGVFEATAIALAIEGTPVSRPTSHDLIKSVIEELRATLESVVITEVKNNTFYAMMVLKRGDEEIRIDARPSDCIAVALRTGAPIYAEESVLKSESIKEVGFDVPDSEEDSFYTEKREDDSDDDGSSDNADSQFDVEDFIKNLNPNDFGNDENG